MKIEVQLRELRLHGMCSSWQALLETRRHHELNLAEGLELLLQAEQQQRSDSVLNVYRRTHRSATKLPSKN
jgi:hypothetical protein